MTTFANRTVVLFAIAAAVPVVLTTLVWLGVAHSGGAAGTREAELARERIEELTERRITAVERLCRDDLAVDRLLEDLAGEREPELDYDRLFRGSMLAAGLDVLWIVDENRGTIVARGHRPALLGGDGSELAKQGRGANGEEFALFLGSESHQRFVVQACSIARGGARLAILGGHRLTTLRSGDPDRVRVTETIREGDVSLLALKDSEGVQQTLVVWRSDVDDGAPPLLLWLACVLLVAVGLSLLFGGYLNRWLQSSVDELTAAATKVGRGDFDTTLRDDAGGAFPATATAFNRMTRDLRDAQAQLRRTERAAAWQEIAKSLAHELKNPLSPIRLSIETLRKAHARSHEEFDSLFEESTATILQEVERLREIVDEFSRFARLPAPKRTSVDLRETVSQAASLHGGGLVPVELHAPSAPVEAQLDPDQITQVLHNLLQNARDAAISAHPEGGGRVVLRLTEEREAARIDVEDNGAGIPSDLREAIFDPYFTRKEGGTGLGLAISQRIVTEHGGRIELRSRPGQTVFSVVLPDGT